MPMRPGRGKPVSNEALKIGYQPRRTTNKPRQFGPSSRIPPARAASSIRACAAAPASPVSAKPAVNTIAAAVPRAASAATAAIAGSTGMATIATSGTSGRSATEGYARKPWISERFGLTGRMTPEKPRARM